MANLFAAKTALLQLVVILDLFVGILVFFVVFRLVLRELATASLLASLTAAPPHFSAELTLMGAATPVKVFFFKIVFATLLTDLGPSIELTAPVLQLFYPLLHLLTLLRVHLELLLLLSNLLESLLKFLTTLRQIFLHLRHPLLERLHSNLLFSLNLVLEVEQVSRLAPELITLVCQVLDLPMKSSVVLQQLLVMTFPLLDLLHELVFEILSIRYGLDRVEEQFELFFDYSILHLLEGLLLFKQPDVVFKTIVLC